MSATRNHAGPGFWLFLYSVGTVTVFVVILASETASGRVLLAALGKGSFLAGRALADGLLAWARETRAALTALRR
jgi:hypothetical protein